MRLSARTPEDVAAALSETASLEAAASQLASVLQIAPDAVRVRIRTPDAACATSRCAPNWKHSKVVRGRAAPLIEVNMTFWLVAEDVVCEYALLGEALHPARAGLRSSEPLERREMRPTTPSMLGDEDMKVGVFAVMFSAMKFEDALDYIKSVGVQAVEVGCGGYIGGALQGGGTSGRRRPGCHVQAGGR